MAALLVGHVLERWPGRESLQMLIAVILADAADRDGSNVYPSVDRVAKLARCGVRSVQYALRDFVEMGFLVLEQPGGGRGRPARYRIVRTWLESQQSALLSSKNMGAEPAGNFETVHANSESAQDPCKKAADSLHQLVHPTQQPLPRTQKAAAALQDFRLTDENIVIAPGNVLDELGLVEIRRIESVCPGSVAVAIGLIVEQGKRPFISAMLPLVQSHARQCAAESAKRQTAELGEVRQKQAMAYDPAAKEAGNRLLAQSAAKRAAKAQKGGGDE